MNTAHVDPLLHCLWLDPCDVLSLRALADAYEEQGAERQSFLLRLAADLREIEFPTEPGTACETFFMKRHNTDPDQSSVELSGRTVGVTGESAKWPRCRGWHGVGRLPGVAAGLSITRLADLTLTPEGVLLLRRHLLRCELRCCGVPYLSPKGDGKERFVRELTGSELGYFEYHPIANSIAPEGAMPWGPSPHVAWALLGGVASSAVGMMLAHQVAYHVAMTGGSRYTRGVHGTMRPHSDFALATCRTYHRDLLRTFLAAEPWRYGRGFVDGRRRDTRIDGYAE